MKYIFVIVTIVTTLVYWKSVNIHLINLIDIILLNGGLGVNLEMGYGIIDLTCVL